MWKALSWVDALSLWSGRIAAWLTLVGILILTYEVAGRYFFGFTWPLAHELSTKLLGVMYVLAGSYALLEKSHVGVDVLYSRMPRKVKAGIDVFVSVFFFLFVGAILIYGWEFFTDSYGRLQRSLENPELVVYPFKFFIPLGALLLLLQGIANLIRDIAVLMGKSETEVDAKVQKVDRGY